MPRLSGEQQEPIGEQDHESSGADQEGEVEVVLDAAAAEREEQTGMLDDGRQDGSRQQRPRADAAAVGQ